MRIKPFVSIPKSLREWTDWIRGGFDESLPSYTKTTLPDAASNVRKLIYVSNESGGAVPAFSDGTNWRRVTDRAIVS